MKTLNLKYRGHLPSGAFGQYKKLSSRRGVKMLHGEFDTKKELLTSRDWELAKKELSFIQQASKFNIAPKGYKVVPVRVDGCGWKAGIVMQHLNGRVMSYSAWERQEEKREKIIEILRNKARLYRSDNHSENFMVVGKRKKIYMVDFSPSCVRKLGGKKKKK